MWLNKRNTLTTGTSWHSEKEPQSKTDLKQNFSDNSDSELIEKEYEALPKMIESLIRENFLKKEFYENLPDWTNPEIDNICNHSASDIENRIKEGKWILFMNSCISQTLYFVDKLKKAFPHLAENTDLCIEVLRLVQPNLNSAHIFIQINISNHEPIIIDFAHDNDVFIYQGKYTNRSRLKTQTEKMLFVPVNSFDENDTIFDIAMKNNIFKEWDFDQSSHTLNNSFFSQMMSSRKDQLKKHNSREKFESWEKSNKEIRIRNSLRA